jgi:hypothetical protein
MKKNWTEATDEVKKAFSEKEVIKYEVDYDKDNSQKTYTIIYADKTKATIGQYFDMSFFNPNAEVVKI